MTTKLTDREIALVARMLRIGMTQETIARIVKTNTATIQNLIEADDSCKQAYALRPVKAVSAPIVPQNNDCEQDEEYVSTTPVPPVMEEAKIAASKGFPDIASIKRYIAERYDVTIQQMDDGTRIWRRVRAREAAICTARMMWPHLTLMQVGRHFGSRQHATVLYILKKHGMSTASTQPQKHAA